MSRYFPDRKDSTGWKRGQGPYSRSHLKLNKPPEYSPFAQAGNDDHHHPKSIFSKVMAVGSRNFGLSAEVSRGRRPVHTAKTKPEGYGIDPSTPKFVKHKDYR
jgi:hypothetical protein